MTASAPAETLRQIAMFARTGRLDDAALAAAQAFAVHGDDPVLAALSGAVEAHRGQFARAADYLAIARRHRPDDVTVRTNLAEALFHCGRPDEARDLCEEAVALNEPTGRLARLAGFFAQEEGAFDEAARLYRSVLAKQEGDWSLWNNLGNALVGAGDAEGAVVALEKARVLAPDSAPIRLNLGNALIEAGQFEAGEQVLSEAARDFPSDIEPLIALINFYRQAGNEDALYAILAEASARAPEDAGLQSDYGQEAARRNEYAVAEPAFHRALAIEPALGPPFVGLAALYERTNREDELEPLRERAVVAGVDAQTLASIDALRFKRGERFEDALEALEQAGDVVLPNRRHQLRGIMLDRLGRYDEALAEFEAMNARHRDEPSQPLEKARAYRESVAADALLLSAEWLAGWTPAPAMERPSPVFLLGFPRSGTTLLDTMLMSAPGTLVLEEEHFIADIERELGGAAALPGLAADAIVSARARYFAKVAAAGELSSDTLVVDKHPLHLNKVPVIRRLFPDARFILALRHPCDVLLSCFITNFRTNHAMSNFLDLDVAAELYDQSFAYWTRARAIFDLPVRTVVYERLVTDQGRELAPLFDWLGLTWQGEGFDHRDAARARGVVRTASYSQVTEPIYTRAAGRWHRYEKHLEPVFDRLRPWVEAFGYSLDDDRVPGWDDDAGGVQG